MKKFRMVVDPLGIGSPSDEQIKMAIAANNACFEVWQDMNGVIIRCENQPRDMLIYGICFVEMLDN